MRSPCEKCFQIPSEAGMQSSAHVESVIDPVHVEQNLAKISVHMYFFQLLLFDLCSPFHGNHLVGYYVFYMGNMGV